MDKKILTVLGASLALNFMFIGFEASRICCRPAAHFPPERPAFASGEPMGKFAAPEHKMMKEAFKNVFKNHEKDLKNAKKAVEEALNKEPFDTEQFKQALQKASAVRQSVDEAVQENMVEMISKMTPEERRRFAEGFAKAKKHFKHNAEKMKKECREKKHFRKHFEDGGNEEFSPNKHKRSHHPDERNFREDDREENHPARKEFRKKMRERKAFREKRERPENPEEMKELPSTGSEQTASE